MSPHPLNEKYDTYVLYPDRVMSDAKLVGRFPRATDAPIRLRCAYKLTSTAAAAKRRAFWDQFGHDRNPFLIETLSTTTS